MNIETKTIQDHWIPIRHLFSVGTEEEYERTVEFMNDLIDQIGTDERHPFYGLLDALGTIIHAYEEDNYPVPDSDGQSILAFLMDEHGLTSSDLPEIGSEKEVVEILDGTRELSIRQVRALAERLHVSPAVFF